MLMLPLKSTVLERDLGRQVAGLFGAGVQGTWYDPSDFSTLFQDAAGTTPVTAVEQPVGRMLDKSGRGNHASQATTTKRPIYSRRVNLLLNSIFSNSGGLPTGWAPSGAGRPVPTGLAANGDVIYTAAANGDRPFAGQGVSVTAGVPYELSVEIVAASGTCSALQVLSLSIAGSGVFSLNGVAIGAGANVSPGRLKFIFTPSSSGAPQFRIGLGVQSNNDAGSVSFHSPSLTLATDAHLPYQWVNTATDYDADPAKFPAYLRFDGVDDALQTGNIDFTSTDKMTVWAGVTKMSDPGVICELGVFSNEGMYGTFSMQSQTGGYIHASRGTFGASASLGTGYSAPNSSVLTGVSSIGDDYLALKINGISAAQSTKDQGSGKYGTYLLSIGARNGTWVYFNGRLYSLIVRGAQSSLSQIAATEAYIKQKMRLS